MNPAGSRTPRLDQAGWLRAQEISRSNFSARRRGGRVISNKEFSVLNLLNRPVRSLEGGYRDIFLVVAATPPDPGGEFDCLLGSSSVLRENG